MGKWITKAKQYRIDNEKFLEAKSREEGIVALESGISMKLDGIPANSTLVFELQLVKIQ